MCTFIIHRRPNHAWPVLIAANRDEMADRPWRPPARHWPDRPNVIGGLDELAGGTWLGLNDEGVVAAIMNRRGTLGPLDGKRSRGELVLEALDHADANDAAAALAELDPAAYRPFNLVVADNRDAYWLANRGASRPGIKAIIEVWPLPEGLSIICAGDRNDPTSARTRFNLPRLEATPLPDPEGGGGSGDWAAWAALLASRDHDPQDGPDGAMNVVTDTGFATLSSSLIALPAPALADRRPVWRFAGPMAADGAAHWDDVPTARLRGRSRIAI